MLRWLVTDEQELLRVGIDRHPERILGRESLAIYEAFPSEKRRRDWLLGRWTAKRVVARMLGELAPSNDLLRQIEVVRTETGEPHVAAQAVAYLPYCGLSISHAGGRALVAATTDPHQRIGVDLEPVVSRHPGLVRDFFTPSEANSVAAFPKEKQALAINTIWSAKEAVLKVLGVGLSVSSFTVECSPIWKTEDLARWQRCPVKIRDYPATAKRTRAIHTWWTARDGFVNVLSLGLRDE